MKIFEYSVRFIEIFMELSKYFPRSFEHVLNNIYYVIIKSVDIKGYVFLFLVDAVRWESCGI